MADIIAILDRSGSMSGLETEVIGSFNKFIKDQQADESKNGDQLTLVLFDHLVETPFSSMPLSEVSDINEETYFTRGMTSLYDAIGRTITLNTFKGITDVIVLIQTDGMDNSSTEFTQARIKGMVTAKEAYGWEFIFMGANIDAKETGANLGININNAINFNANARGVQMSYDTMSNVTSAYKAKQ